MNVPAGSACSRQVLAVIAVVTLVRALVSLQGELTSVESYSWMYAQYPSLGYYDHPGMVGWWGRLSSVLFGSSALGFRALPLAGSAGMIWMVFLATRRLYSECAARLAALLVAFVPLFFIFSWYTTPDAPCLFFWSATVWALAHALSGDAPRWWYAAGLFLGLALDSKYPAVFLGLGVFGFLLFSPEQRFWLKRREPWIGVVLAVLAFSPTFVWNARNEWQSFAYQGVSRFKESGFQPAQVWRFVSSQLYLLTPAVAVGAWGAGITALVRWRRIDWKDRFLSALGAPLLIFFAAVMFVRPVRGHWAASGYVTAVMLSAAFVVKGGRWTRRLYWGSIALLAVGTLILPVFLAFTPRDQRKGWAFLGEEVKRRNPDFIVCNEYHLASQMGYVLRTRDSWDLTPIGKPSKSFPNWWDEKRHLGKNAVIVYDSRHFPGEMDRIKECFGRIDRAELVLVPRLQVGPFGDDERYWILNAWNYKGPRLLYPRAPESGD
ncbi:MAG TPA: glycosyltransferase family 39 protein [Planctomycetota bacterium]|nr:glycosyltransferase family 39 protein [Planctomycetota bacterium]